MQTSQRFCLQTSHGEGVSVLNLPSYVFKGVIVTFKKNEMCMCVHIHNEHMDREVKEGSDLVGETVLFTVEDAARKSLKVRNMVLADVSVFLPPSSVKQDMAGLTTLIDDQLKTCLLSMTKNQEIAKLVLAVIRRETQLAGQTTIQDKVARMISSKVSSMVKSLAGCQLL